MERHLLAFVVLLFVMFWSSTNADKFNKSQGISRLPGKQINRINYLRSGKVGAAAEHQVDLVAKIVPYVINPRKDFKAPTFAIALYKYDVLIGSGAIIAKHYVLTLCSVLHSPGSSKQEAGAFIIKYSNFSPTKTLTLIKEVSANTVLTHPECGDNIINPAKNIGLIRTKEPMNHIKYPELPTGDLPENKGLFILSNFRVLNHAATNEETATWSVTTRKVDDNICTLLFSADNEQFVPNDNLCIAYYHMGDANYCKGDVGLPLTFRYKGVDTIFGLNMHKHTCGRPREVASFISVKANLEWIRKNMNSD